MDIANALASREAQAAERAVRCHLDRASAVYGSLESTDSAEVLP